MARTDSKRLGICDRGFHNLPMNFEITTKIKCHPVTKNNLVNMNKGKRMGCEIGQPQKGKLATAREI